MTRREAELDGALARLAREAAEACPRPGPDLVARVLADAALTGLARDAAEAAPRPGADLVARVLADAAATGAPRAAEDRRKAGPRAAAARRRGLIDVLFGWRAGAVAAMAAALAVGLGLGMGIEALPVIDAPAGSEAISLASIDAAFMELNGL